MKKLFLFLTTAMFLTTSCELLDKLTQFDMDYDESFTIISGIPVNIPFEISTPAIKTNSESTFEGENTAKNLIEEVSLKELRLVISTPTDANFDFFKSLKLYIKAEGMDEVLIAAVDNIPDGLRELDLDVENVNLKDYIIADEYQLKIETTTDKLIAEDVDVDIKTVFHVNASILGI